MGVLGLSRLHLLKPLDAKEQEEACRRLQDTDNKLPILSIALDVGYSSINPFNRAFKDAMGETPSNYRKYCQH